MSQNLLLESIIIKYWDAESVLFPMGCNNHAWKYWNRWVAAVKKVSTWVCWPHALWKIERVYSRSSNRFYSNFLVYSVKRLYFYKCWRDLCLRAVISSKAIQRLWFHLDFCWTCYHRIISPNNSMLMTYKLCISIITAFFKQLRKLIVNTEIEEASSSSFACNVLKVLQLI